MNKPHLRYPQERQEWLACLQAATIFVAGKAMGGTDPTEWDVTVLADRYFEALNDRTPKKEKL